MLPSATARSGRPTVFLSYSHRDERWKDRFEVHLRALGFEGVLELWDDRRIAVGVDWLPELIESIDRAAVVVLLISADFLTSKFVLREEVPRLLERRRSQGLRVIPLIVRSCAWTEVSWLSAIQPWPQDGAPLYGIREAKVEEVLAALALEVRDVLHQAPPLAVVAHRPTRGKGAEEDNSDPSVPDPVKPAGRAAQVIPVRDHGDPGGSDALKIDRGLSPEQPDDAEYRVWYGTNRRPRNAGDLGQGFSADCDTTVHYGVCRVFVPKSHKIGSTGSPWWKRLFTRTDDRLRLLELRDMPAEGYWTAMSNHLAQLDIAERDAVILVHGYNVSFEEAALRAAQIGFDLSIRGAMAFFSWPSQGTLLGYLADEDAIEWTVRAVADFMVDVATRSGARTVHVVAHSMGNRAVLRAVERIALEAKQRSGVHFGQFILAAADVNAETFRLNCDAYRRVARGATLYVSGRDRAIEASSWLHRFPRAGLAPPVLVAPGIDTVNVTAVDLTMLGHGYVADARDVLRDMHDLIHRGTPPDNRFGLRAARTESGERYWRIGG